MADYIHVEIYFLAPLAVLWTALLVGIYLK